MKDLDMENDKKSLKFTIKFHFYWWVTHLDLSSTLNFNNIWLQLIWITISIREIMSELLAAKQAEEAKVGQWAASSIHKGSSREAEICCNPAGTSCEPFPGCCDCEAWWSIVKHHLFAKLK